MATAGGMSGPSSEPNLCKHCLRSADEEEGGPFVDPCGCCAPLHQRCLFQWICDQQRTDCEACHGQLLAGAQTEAEAARRDKEEAQAERDKERYRGDQLELQVISLREDLGRLRALLGRQGGEVLPQQPQQAQQALQAQRGLPPQQEQQLAAENRQLQGEMLRLLAALGRTDLEQQAAAEQQAAEQLRLQAEVRRLQAHIQQLEPEAEMMRSIRQHAQQAHQAQQAQQAHQAQGSSEAQQVRGSSEAQQNGGKQAQRGQQQQSGAKQPQQEAGRRHKTREDYMRRRQPGVNGRRSGASSEQLIGQLPQQWAVVAVGALGMALCALTSGVALSQVRKMRERQQAHQA